MSLLDSSQVPDYDLPEYAQECTDLECLHDDEIMVQMGAEEWCACVRMGNLYVRRKQ